MDAIPQASKRAEGQNRGRCLATTSRPVPSKEEVNPVAAPARRRHWCSHTIVGRGAQGSGGPPRLATIRRHDASEPGRGARAWYASSPNVGTIPQRKAHPWKPRHLQAPTARNPHANRSVAPLVSPRWGEWVECAVADPGFRRQRPGLWNTTPLGSDAIESRRPERDVASRHEASISDLTSSPVDGLYGRRQQSTTDRRRSAGR